MNFNPKTMFILTAITVVGMLLFRSNAWAQSTYPSPSGIYRLDPLHSNVNFKIKHLGFSYFNGRFDKFDGVLVWNNAAPQKSTLVITVYPNSIDVNNPELEEDLRGDHWLNVIRYKMATFSVSDIEVLTNRTGILRGDFMMLGQTNTLVLNTTLEGSGINPLTHKYVLGFSGVGHFQRSRYGLTNLLPMIGDDVMLEIDAEFDKDGQS